MCTYLLECCPRLARSQTRSAHSGSVHLHQSTTLVTRGSLCEQQGSQTGWTGYVGYVNTIIILLHVQEYYNSLVVCKLQVAVLARSPREMSQTVRIDWQHFLLSRVCVSIFYTWNTPKNSRKPCRPRKCLFQWTSDRLRKGVELHHGWSPATHRTAITRTAITAVIAATDWAKTAKKQQVKTATTRVYTFTAWTIWLMKYHVAHAFVVCRPTVCVMCLKYTIIIFDLGL